MVHINDLPDEVLEFIMSYLPPYKDLEECNVVCKRWSLIVKNVMHYARMNLNKGLSEYRVCWKASPIHELTSIITGRFSHSAVMHKNSMFVFGGRSSATTTFNDLWCFDLSKRVWVRQLPMGTYPSPKACATMVNHEGRLILFGGVRHPGLGQFLQLVKLFDELHIYDITETRWTVYTSPQSPPPSAGHSASIRKNQMVIFGGFQTTTEIDGVSNDIWCLNLKSFQWHKQDTLGNVKPPPRYGQFQITLDDNYILVLGGCGGPNNVFSDAWLLNTEGDVWKWKQVEIKNKKWAATHMWCNPAAKVGSKLVVLGPTPAMPTDFQIVKQVPHSSGSRSRHSFNIPGHRRPPYDDRPPSRENINNAVGRNNQQPIPQVNENVNNNSQNIQNRSPRNNDEAAVRLQRNLQQLRNRDDEHLLPKRFDEPFQDRLGMAAFNLGENPNSSIRERQLERLRRMQDKYHEIRRQTTNQHNQKSSSSSSDSGSSSPKRIKRNCIAMFVCDLSNLLRNEPYLEWLEFKNYGIATGAPERLILSSIVAGKGELIMFGGLLKESLTNECVQVSNSVHFLTVPRGII